MFKMNERKSFYVELLIGSFIIAAAVLYVGRIFYFCDNSYYINTTDALPIYSKAIYVAESLRNMEWPSWFPYWYCGTSVSQYYPPLVYIILGPLEAIIDNPMLVLKLYIYSGLFIGGLGIWYGYNRNIGAFFGIPAAVLYVMLPYFTISFFNWGTIAQIPIVAAAPWYMTVCLKYFNRSKVLNWFGLIFIMSFMLLSHIMHGFMIALSFFVTIAIFVVVRKISLTDFSMWILGTALSAGLTGFWWLTGAFRIESPDIPSLSSGNIESVTANLTWFFPGHIDFIEKVLPGLRNEIQAYFPISIIVFALFSLIFIRREEGKKKDALLFLFVNTMLSFTVTFGFRLPLFSRIPFSNHLLPGRLLTQAAIGAVMLTSYCIYNLSLNLVARKGRFSFKQITDKAIEGLVLAVLLFLLLTSYSEEKANLIGIVDKNEYMEPLYAELDAESENFDKGRLAWFGGHFGSMYVYRSYLSKYNIVSGWNSEGTSSSDFLVFQNTALSKEKEGYILKHIDDMNVQVCMVEEIFSPWLIEPLKGAGFEEIGRSGTVSILKKDEHSYFLIQERNGLVIGKASNLFLADYPWFVKGSIANPMYYDDMYYDDYEVIYFCDPEINNERELKNFEELIRRLTSKSKRIYIEFGRSEFPAPVLGVTPIYVEIEKGYVISGPGEPNGKTLGDYSSSDRFVQLLGLDDCEYSLVREDKKHKVDFFGTRHIEGSEVYFVGGPFSQLKQIGMEYLTGKKEVNPYAEERDEAMHYIFEESLKDIDLFRSLELPKLDVENVSWGRNDCMFECNLKEDARVMVSVTYSPRWTVEVDGEPIVVQRVDNMLSFHVPEGTHEVSMVYKITMLGKIGIVITILSFLFILLIAKGYDAIMVRIQKILSTLTGYLT